MTPRRPQVPPRPRSRGGKHLRRSARDRNFFQFAIGKKSDIGVIGRPERIAGAIGALQDGYAGEPMRCTFTMLAPETGSG